MFIALAYSSLVPLDSQNVQACNHENAFIKLLKSAHPNRVRIHDRPTKSNLIYCQEEWSVYGNCCDQTSLSFAFHSDAKKINASIHDLNTALERSQSVIKSAIVALDMHSQHKKDNEGLKGEDENDEDLKKDGDKTEDPEHLKAAFAKYINQYDLKNLSHYSTECWNYMNHLRS